MVHVGASREPKIALHKSTMENPLLYREKNEVAGMGRRKKKKKKKLVRLLVLGGKRRSRRKENARATERKWSTLIQQYKSEERPTFGKIFLTRQNSLICKRKKKKKSGLTRHDFFKSSQRSSGPFILFSLALKTSWKLQSRSWTEGDKETICS